MQNNGLLTAIMTFGIWGVFPVYWKFLGGIPAYEILAHRILGSFAFMACLVTALNLRKNVYSDWQKLAAKPKELLLAIFAAILVSANWGVFIWAVNAGRVLETSLGYYINPLVSVLLGIVFLHEKMNFWQGVAVFLAVAGVGNMTLHFGNVPWVSLALAFTMGFYGLCKKAIGLNVFSGMTIETAFIAPLALCYILWLYYEGRGFVFSFSMQTIFLLGAGVVTAVPLLLFANSANKLPLSVLGLTQYLSPTMTFALGVFLYHEPFTTVHLVSFGLIWVALVIFSLSGWLHSKQK